MREKIKAVFGLMGMAVVGVGFLLYLGLGIQTMVPMPHYAYVYLDDAAKTYIALPCMDEWYSRTREGNATLRLSQVKEARALKYKGDERCRDAGAFMVDGPTATGRLLAWFGVEMPSIYWWDQPFKLEDGRVIQPKP